MGYSSNSPANASSRSSPLMVIGPYLVFFLGLAMLAQAIWMNNSRARNPVLPQQEPYPPPVAPPGNLADDERATINLFKTSSRSVVFITSTEVGRDLNFNVQEMRKGTGSGFVWDQFGHIVTNYHVVEGANRLRVTLSDQSTWLAKLVGVAPDKDIAVLRIDAPAEQLHPILVGRSGELEVGQKVFAIGNPFGLDQTLTTGVISGVGRQIKAETGRTIDGVIQTDAAINPGNSGGPLLDSSGRLIGMNTAIYSPSGASVGIGFAIPIDTVQRIVPQILQFGKVIRPGLGITYAEDSLARKHRLPGVWIVNISPDGPAARAGLRPTRLNADGVVFADLIIAVNGRPIHSVESLLSALEACEVGQTVKLTIVRNARTKSQESFEVEAVLQAIE